MDDNNLSLDELIAQHPIEISRAIDKFLSEQRLIHFIEAFWHFVEPSVPFVSGWAVESICEHLEAVSSGEIKRLLINCPPGMMKSLSTNCFYPAWEWGPLNMPVERYVCASYTQSLTIRDNVRFKQVISSDLYKMLWGDRFGPSKEQNNLITVGNTKRGWKLATSISGVGTGMRGSRVILDDPNNVQDAESEAIRTSTNRWVLEVMPSRLQNLASDAIIIIQQRTHESDVSGVILDRDLGYSHLCIPMHFDSRRWCTTEIGWSDPRGLDDSGNPLIGADLEARDGELAFPERFSAKDVAMLERSLGEYACNPHEAPVLMDDLSLKPIGEVKSGDAIIGFEKNGPPPDMPELIAARKYKLVKTKVIRVFSSVKPVVKMTLDSGQVIRCTADHKWFRKARGQDRPEYLPANIGSPLVRVCPPILPVLTYDEQRMAGWLSGFFDGEGSVTTGKRKDTGFYHYNPSSQICFYQGAGRNLPLCEKLEEYLTYFGFEFSCRHYVRQDRKKPCEDGFFENRHYRLVNTGVREYQKFLHIIQPTKWRDRIIDAACKGKFREGYERVVSIEPDGEEMTYALETETGNYVVWGLASSNSAGQLEQIPVPRGGGIFKREWWNSFPPDDWPAPAPGEKPQMPKFSYICAALDTALTEKEENDYSALTVWGVWHSRENPKIPPRIVEDPNGMLRMGDNDQPKAMLMFGWQKRLHLYGPPEYKPEHMSEPQWNDPLMMAERQKSWGLMEWVIWTCKKFKVDNLLIEDKAAGHTVHQELARLNINQMWSTQLVDPRNQDKVARAYSIQHLFSNGVIYAPRLYNFTENAWRFPTWCEAIVNEMSAFPKAAHDDATDSSVYALRHLRDIGVLLRRDEAEMAFTEDLMWRGRQGALYEL